MKKFVIITLMALCLSFSLIAKPKALAEDVSTVRIIYPYAYVYESTNAGEENAVILKTCIYNEELTLNKTDIVTGAVDGFNYYEVVLVDVTDHSVGYVLKSQAVNAEIQSPQKELASNATVNKESIVYTFNGTDYIQTQTKLQAGTPIRILSGYDGEKDYTHIQYTDENKNIVTAYLKTDDIHVAGVSRATIAAVIIIVTTISLALIIFGISGKKRKKKI